MRHALLAALTFAMTIATPAAAQHAGHHAPLQAVVSLTADWDSTDAVLQRYQRASANAPSLRWELIGHLQSNKARQAAQAFDRIQSVDSEKLLRHLDRAAADLGQVLPILLQINAGNDPAKFGAEPGDASALCDAALGCAHLRLDGLMTIAPKFRICSP